MNAVIERGLAHVQKSSVKSRMTVARVLAGVAILAASASSKAALPDGVATAITAYQADMTTGIGLILAAGVVIWGLIKLGRKFGWF